MAWRDPSKLTLERYVRGVVRAVGIQLLVVVILTASVFAYLLYGVGPQLESAIENSRGIRSIHEAMLDQETSLRDHLLTGDERSLAPYEEGRQEMETAIEDVEAVLASHSRFGSDFVDVRLAQQRWIDQWALPAADSGPDTFASVAERDAFIREGRELFDDYRTEVDALIDDLVTERRRLLDRQEMVLGIASAVALASGLVLLALTLMERRRIDAIVVEPVEDLRRTMERISHGDFTARPKRGGTIEMQQLADSLDAMADQLHDALRVVGEQAASLTERSERQAGVLSMARDIAGSLNLGYVQRAVADQAQNLASASAVSVWVVQDGGEAAELTEAWHQDHRSSVAGARHLELGQGLPGEVARDGRAKSTDERGTPSVSVVTDRPVASLGVPMIVGARVVGVIEMCFEPPAEIDNEAVSMIETLASHAGTAIEAARLHEATRELSQIDALTTLYNRRRLDTDLADEVTRCIRYDRPLSFLMADLDHFKRFNDDYGHQRGDEVLQEVARMLAGAVRSSDTVYRYGGEEISILFRETTVEDATALAERLRADIEHHFRSDDGRPAVTISMGLATLGVDLSSPELIIGAADGALYEAKAAGRNRVAVDGR